MLDLVLQNATIVDGSGAPRRPGSVGVRDGRIVALGVVAEPAARVVDVDGQVVSPGFVDVHTHYDAQIFWDPLLTPSVLHGVTTVMAGNCGFSIAPLASPAGPYLMAMLARVEGMPLHSLETGVPWDWESTADYFARVGNGLGINAGFMVGHCALRRVVMGEAATERAATKDEIAAMCRLLEQGLAAGGMGFSSTTGETHNDASGGPVPSRFAEHDEFLALAEVTGRYPGTSVEFLPFAAGNTAKTIPDDTVELMIGLTVTAKRPLNWNTIAARAANVDNYLEKLTISDMAKSRGGKIVALAVPMEVQARVSFGSGFNLDQFEGWNELMTRASKEERIAAFRDPDRRRELGERAANTPHHGALASWATHTILETFTPQTKRFEGRSVASVAEELGKEPFDALVDVSLQDDMRTTFARGKPPLTDDDWNARLTLWKDPRVVLGASDAGAHLDMMSMFRYTTTFMQESVREKGYFGLEEAVHLLTQVPASLYGLKDRGVLREGAWADLVVFDPDTVGPEQLHTRFDLPGGAGRLYAEAHGIEHVFVAGTDVVAGGEATGELPGVVLRSGRDSDNPSMV